MDYEYVDSVTRLDASALEILAETEFHSQATFNPRRARRVAYAMERLGLGGNLAGTRVLELGPGHYGFAMLARAYGANVTCLENDDAFVRLGQHLGFSVIAGDFYSRIHDFAVTEVFGGLWVKGTFNACRLGEPSLIHDFARRLDACLEPAGWGLLVPVNKVRGGSDSPRAQECIEVQTEIMSALGWDAIELSESERRAMAFHYAGSPYIFLKNLEFSANRFVAG